MRGLLAIALIVSLTTASAAATYGSPAACEFDRTGEVSPNVRGDVLLLLTDHELMGTEFVCDLATARDGHITCDGEGSVSEMPFSVERTASHATVQFDGETYTLPRCDVANP